MSETMLKRLVALLAVAVALYTGLAIASHLGRGGSGSDESGVATALARTAQEDLTAVRIEGGGEPPIALRREDGVWRANEFEADSAVVERLMRAIENTVVGQVVATNPNNHERMGVAGQDARTLTLESASGATTMVLGNAGSRFGTSYARLPDDEAVVTLEGDLRAAALRGIDEWRNKAVLRVERSTVAAIVVEASDGSYRLERLDQSWTVDGSPADSAAVRRMLDELTSLDATGFAPDSARVEGEEVETIRLLDAEGQPLAVLRALEVSGSLWIQRQDGDVVFTLPSWRADRIRPSRDSFDSEGT